MSRTVAHAPDTRGQPDHAHWEAATWDDGNHVHVVPVGDGIKHIEDDDATCVCGPVTEAVFREDGSSGWLITHHSLDDRERYERETA